MKARIILRGIQLREMLAYLMQSNPQLEPMLSLDAIEVVVQKLTKKRSKPQNARYWSIIGALGEFSGLTKEEMHEECLCEYSGFDLVEFRGSIRKRPRRRSSKLTTVEFGELMLIAERWAVEFGVFWEEYE